MDILDQYVKTFPSAQNAIDIFRGEWSSALPNGENKCNAGSCELFNDSRIHWAAEISGGFGGKKIVELGPLEAGHTWMLEQMGADSVLAIEANSRAFLKCLIVKEILNMKRSSFILGDFVEFLRETQQTFDVCLASGVLYHMKNPAELLGLIAKVCDEAIIWTHYYDRKYLDVKPGFKRQFSGQELATHDGFQHTLYKQHYRTALKWTGFCGGSDKYSYWMNYDDILHCLRYFGFSRIEISHHEPDHPHGPAFCLYCAK